MKMTQCLEWLDLCCLSGVPLWTWDSYSKSITVSSVICRQMLKKKVRSISLFSEGSFIPLPLI